MRKNSAKKVSKQKLQVSTDSVIPVMHVPDITKLKALGWSPKRTAEDSVKEYVEYLKAQTDINDILEYA